MRIWIPQRVREGMLIGAAALLLTGLLFLRTPPLLPGRPEFAQPWDHHKYLRMAEQPFTFHIAPFCWRILHPLLANVLPWETSVAFRVLCFAALVLTGGAVYYLARGAGFGAVPALTGMLFFYSLGWAARFPAYCFWSCDPLGSLFVTLALIAILSGNDRLVAVLLAVGVMAKESVLLVAPLHYTLHARRVVDPDWAKRALLVAAPAVGVLLLLRWAIPAMNSDPGYLATLPETLRSVQYGSSRYDYFWLLAEIPRRRLHTLSLDDLSAFSLGTFGPGLGLLPLFALPRARGLLLRVAPFLVLVYAQLLFAVNTERLLVLAFPVLILLALHGLDALAERSRLAPAWFALLPTLMLGLNLLSSNAAGASLQRQLAAFFAGILLLGGVRWARGTIGPHPHTPQAHPPPPGPVPNPDRA